MEKNEDLIKKFREEGKEARQSILEDMQHRGFAAIVWGENLFGSTDYPLIDNGGREVSLKGFRVTSPDTVTAIIGLPDDLDIVGVRTFSEGEADKVLGTMANSLASYANEGTPEQWEVGADCYKVALEYLKTKKEEKADTWW